MLQTLATRLLGGGLGSLADSVAGAVDRFVETPDEARDAELLKLQIQTEINKAEAGHRTLFVAGWRPFVGWVCGMAFAYHFIVQPVMFYLAGVLWGSVPVLPAFDTSTLLYVLGGMLGLGGFRSLEKAAGKAR